MKRGFSNILVQIYLMQAIARSNDVKHKMKRISLKIREYFSQSHLEQNDEDKISIRFL